MTEMVFVCVCVRERERHTHTHMLTGTDRQIMKERELTKLLEQLLAAYSKTVLTDILCGYGANP